MHIIDYNTSMILTEQYLNKYFHYFICQVQTVFFEQALLENNQKELIVKQYNLAVE